MIDITSNKPSLCSFSIIRNFISHAQRSLTLQERVNQAAQPILDIYSHARYKDETNDS
jgi:hypothetical protein